MVFNSATFLIFIVLFFAIFWWLNNRFSITWRNAFTLVASYIFYGWWDWRFLSLIVGSSLLDFCIGLSLGKTEKASTRKWWLIGSISINLGLLGFFKYYGFFVDSFVEFLQLFSIEVKTSTLNIVLPVGISFYSFQTMSYTIDVYRKQLVPTKNALTFFTFVAFFPQLVAGPIERASHLLQQFDDKKRFKYETATNGMRLIVWGFFKKIVIADNFGFLADSLFNADEVLSGGTVALGAIFFAIQIYGDFSGYSDIAIGISKLLGFDLMTNFKTPYFSKTFAEFWQRWHISLSTWFRDYVYIPLGGNRGTAGKVYRNLMLTFLLSGLWHGANSTFLIWGGLHGAMLVLEKRWCQPKYKLVYAPFVLVAVILFWLPFRAVDVSHTWQYAKALVDVGNYSLVQASKLVQFFPVNRLIAVSLVALAFFTLEFFFQQRNFDEWISSKAKWQRWTVYYSLLLVLLFLGNFSVKPSFIYFQF